jgi:IS30 family transposase
MDRHWEGHLIIGKDGRSAVGTLVERSTRMLLHLPGDHTAATVRTAMTAKIKTLPEHLVRSITWDQGTEMAHHAAFSIDTGVDTYFCDPHSRSAAPVSQRSERGGFNAIPNL